MNTLPDTPAIDVVLLPPGPVMDVAIQANRTLIALDRDERIVLDRRNCIPHITVAMAVVRRENLPEVAAAVGRIVRHCTPMTLTIDRIAHSRVSSGDTVSVFQIRRTDILQLLHKAVMKAMKPYRAPEVSPRISADEDAPASSMDCVLRFPERSSFRNYAPHITVGFGKLPPMLPGLNLPLRFESRKAAICHLGSHCTCRSILSSFTLREHEP